MGNNSKQIWMTILVAAVVAVSSSAITASIVSKNVFLGPTIPKAIKANSCDADRVCEVDSLESKGNIKAKSLDAFRAYITELSSEHTMTQALNVQDNIYTEFLSVDQDAAFGSAIVLHQIQLSSKKGDGTAYACIDKEGYIIRSQTPCRR